MIRFCGCKHEEQDKLYGKGQRVHNETIKEVGFRALVRCTVCGKEK